MEMMINDKISERREINIKERVTEKRFRNTKAVEYEIIVTTEEWERDKKNKYIKLKFCDENKRVLGECYVRKTKLEENTDDENNIEDASNSENTRSSKRVRNNEEENNKGKRRKILEKEEERFEENLGDNVENDLENSEKESQNGEKDSEKDHNDIENSETENYNSEANSKTDHDDGENNEDRNNEKDDGKSNDNDNDPNMIILENMDKNKEKENQNNVEIEENEITESEDESKDKIDLLIEEMDAEIEKEIMLEDENINDETSDVKKLAQQCYEIEEGNRDTFRKWFKLGQNFTRKIENLKMENNRPGKKKKSEETITKELRKELVKYSPKKVTYLAIKKKTQRAIKVYNFFMEFGQDKIDRMRENEITIVYDMKIYDLQRIRNYFKNEKNRKI
jgi:hypothetical protein